MGADMSCSEGRNCGDGVCSREGEERERGTRGANQKEHIPMPAMAKSRAQHKVVQVFVALACNPSRDWFLRCIRDLFHCKNTHHTAQTQRRGKGAIGRFVALRADADRHSDRLGS
jgi:hypothetical protein